MFDTGETSQDLRPQAHGIPFYSVVVFSPGPGLGLGRGFGLGSGFGRGLGPGLGRGRGQGRVSEKEKEKKRNQECYQAKGPQNKSHQIFL